MCTLSSIPSLSARLLPLALLAVLPGVASAELLFGRLTPEAAGSEPNAFSDGVDVSSDGRTVVFSSGATNWIPVDPSTTDKAVAIDLDSGLIEIVSRTSGGTIVRGESPAVSRDGRYVAFLNFGGALDVGVPTSGWQVVRKDRVSGQLRLASANVSGEAGNNFVDDDTVSISGDGRFIAFEASSSNFGVATGGFTQVFVKDMDTGALELASVLPGSATPTSDCTLFPHALSDDGRFVTFICNAALVAGATTGQTYVRDLQADATELVSRSGSNGPASTSFTNRAAMSPNGRFVVFQSPAFAGLGGDPAIHSGVYLRDRATSATISIPTPTGANVGGCATSDVSDVATVLLECSVGSNGQVYLHIPGAAGTPFLISSTPAEVPGNARSGATLAVDASGLSMVFESIASNLVTGDTNNAGDVFVLVDDSVLFGIFSDGFED
jgi:Tol biopolymer transport system component